MAFDMIIKDVFSGFYALISCFYLKASVGTGSRAANPARVHTDSDQTLEKKIGSGSDF